MTATLRMTTLGTWSVTFDDDRLPAFHSRKADALLVYLASNRRAHQRSVLADLLWDDISTARALSNLNVLLTSLRRSLADHLTITRQTVALNLHAPYWLDVADLEARIAALLPSHAPTRTVGRSAATQLAQALALYQGDFLQGFAVRGSSGFEQWALSESARLRQMVIDAALVLVASYAQLRAYQAGIDAAQRLLQLDPYHEIAHQLLLELYAANGQRAAALAHYQQYAQLLDTDLGVEPPAETSALYHTLGSPGLAVAGLMPHRLATAHRPVAHAALASMIDREQELRWIAERLTTPACRLLTLVGPGGVGKTRLAFQSARELADRFADGVYAIDLAPLADPVMLVPAMVETLGLTLVADQSPLLVLTNYLRDKQLLLVLDNAEHLLDGVGLLHELLQQTDALTLLVTSRQRLGLRAEWLLDISGLSFPPAEIEPATVVNWMEYGAVRLFAQRALQVQPAFALDAATLPAVLAMCRMLEGLPLGLELAAALTRSRDCATIAATMTHSLDVLATQLYDVPDRHRSLRALFDYSWTLLDPAAQTLLQQLAVFRGSFDTAAAIAIANATPEQLQTLARASLLYQHGEQRYTLHEVVQRYAAERLAAHPAAHARGLLCHATYYAERAQLHAAGLHRTKDAQAFFRQELPNLQAAWAWALDQPNIAVLPQIGIGLLDYYVQRGRLEEAVQTSATLLHVARASDPRPLADLLAKRCALLIEIGRIDEAEQYARAMMECAERSGSQPLAAYATFYTLFSRAAQGDTNIGLAQFAGALTQAEAANLPLLVMQCLERLWRYSYTPTSLAQAHVYVERHLALARAHQHRSEEARALANRGHIASMRGDLHAALQDLRAHLRISQELGDAHGEDVILEELGFLELLHGNYAAAKDTLHRARELCNAHGDRYTECWVRCSLGLLAFQLGAYEQARQDLEASQALCQTWGFTTQEAMALLGLSLIAENTGDAATAYHTARAALDTLQGRTFSLYQTFIETALAHALFALGDLEAAAAQYQTTAERSRVAGLDHLASESLAGLARIALARGDIAAAVEAVIPLAAFFSTGSINSTLQPLRTYAACYDVLNAANDSRAAAVLAAGYRELQRRAATIADADERHTFLERVPTNRALLAAWRTHKVTR